MTSPLCPYFGRCGGCTLQHLEYAQQLEQKKKQLQKLIDFPELKIFSDQPFHYRNRLDFLFGAKGLGLREKEHPAKILPIENCPLAEEKINQILKEVQQNLKPEEKKTYKYAVIRTNTSEETALSFVLNSDSSEKEAALERIKKFVQKTSADNILVTYLPAESDDSLGEEYLVLKGHDYLQEEFAGKKIHYALQGFFQNNSNLAEKMLIYSQELLKKYSTEEAELLDLYGGVGTFGIINAKKFRQVTIIESVPAAIKYAQENIKLNQAKNANAFVLDAQKLNKLKFSYPLFVITDPPRSGMSEKTIIQLKTLQPEVIIYISCNPQQLAKDIQKFKRYQLKSLALFDLFPQTNHFEVIAELQLQN